jgi:hypothetical protein
LKDVQQVAPLARMAQKTGLLQFLTQQGAVYGLNNLLHGY